MQKCTPWHIRLISSVIVSSMLMGVAPVSKIIEVADAFTFQSDGGDLTEVHPGGGLTEIREVSSVETRYGLVAILVNSEVWEDTTSYQGLVSGYSASNTRIFERIQRDMRQMCKRQFHGQRL